MNESLATPRQDSNLTNQQNSDMLTSLMVRASTQATGLLAKAIERVRAMLGKIHKHRANLT